MVNSVRSTDEGRGFDTSFHRQQKRVVASDLYVSPKRNSRN